MASRDENGERMENGRKGEKDGVAASPAKAAGQVVVNGASTESRPTKSLRKTKSDVVINVTDAASTAASCRFDGGTSPISKPGLHFAVAASKREGDEGPSSSTPHIFAMVGLPARGKTYISRKLYRYLNWIGADTKVVNLGDYRRKCSSYDNHSLFSPDNPEGVRIREAVCEQGLKDAFRYIQSEQSKVVVFDATNTTKERRRLLYQRVVREMGYKLFFIESICDDEAIIENNIRSVKVNSPDYVGFTPDAVVEDFKKRIQHYEAQYQTIDEKEEAYLSYLKIFNAGESIKVHKHEGHIQSRIVYYLMNLHITSR